MSTNSCIPVNKNLLATDDYIAHREVKTLKSGVKSRKEVVWFECGDKVRFMVCGDADYFIFVNDKKLSGIRVPKGLVEFMINNNILTESLLVGV